MQIGCCWNLTHLTFRWPFVNISLTIHPTHSKLYILAILITSWVIWYTWKVIWSILKIWPPLDPRVTPTGKGHNRPKFCQNIFWPITTSKPSITHFRQNDTWVLLLLHLHFYSNLISFTIIEQLWVHFTPFWVSFYSISSKVLLFLQSFPLFTRYFFWCRTVIFATRKKKKILM